MSDRLILSRSHWQAMRRHVARRAPLEACGLLAGKEARVELVLGIPNIEHSRVRFRMEPRAQWRAFQRIESLELELIGIYHSHPAGPNHPSATDAAEEMYRVVNIIWYRVNREWRARAYRIEAGKSTEVPLQIED